MKAEIIAVGTELLMGQVVNTNATFIAEELAALGIDVYYQTVVGDNQTRLEGVLQEADSRSDLIILCGGLGPTTDDLTKDTVAAHCHTTLVRDPDGLRVLQAFFAESKKEMTPNNLRQAEILASSTPLKNRTGLALGCLLEASGKSYLLLPGPPNELIPMFQEQARPLLQRRFLKEHLLTSRVLRFYGIGESKLVTLLADLIDAQTNPTIAPYAKLNEVTLRLTAQSQTDAEAAVLLDQTEALIQARVGTFFYGYGENNSLEAVVVNKLRQQHKTVTAAESLTAGLFQAALGSIPGVSEVFPGGFVTYSKTAKCTALGIDPALIARYGVVSKECAAAMAEQARQLLDTDYAVAFTGAAGPDALEGQPAGTVWIAVSDRKQTKTSLHHFSRDRNAVRRSAVMRGLALLNETLNK